MSELPLTRRLAALAVLVAIATCTLLIAAPAPSSAADPPIWRLEQPAPPAGAPFKVPLGEPGDLSFWAPNRGLLTVAGNSTIGGGIYTWDGRSWTQLSTVCGGGGDTSKIAWAGPSEFWVVTNPSLPRGGAGLGLCHFKDGQVVGSYSTRVDAADPFRQMLSAACKSPDDCWFGGIGAKDALGERIGAFHLHWDGTNLYTYYAPQGRGVTDIEVHGGQYYESTLVGSQPEKQDAAVLADPEPIPNLIHEIGFTFASDPFTPAPIPGVPDDGTELLGLDSDGTDLWAVGGGAASGPDAPKEGSVARPPLAAHLVGGSFEELSLTGATFDDSVRFTDVAADPGTGSAWVTAVPFAERGSTNSKATVAHIGADGTTTTTRLPAAGSGRGAAARIACPDTDECWMVTEAGWLFHLTDGRVYPQDTNPAFASLIDFRPNEAAEQYVPDTPPPDDSEIFKPPPPGKPPKPVKLKPLLKDVKSKLHGHKLVVTFQIIRKARVQLVAKRHGRIVGQSVTKKFKPGRGKLAVTVDFKHYPQNLGFRIHEPKSNTDTTPTDPGTDTGDTSGDGSTEGTGGG